MCVCVLVGNAASRWRRWRVYGVRGCGQEWANMKATCAASMGLSSRATTTAATTCAPARGSTPLYTR
eukprot:4242941-Prymnesium_polylepis.2